MVQVKRKSWQDHIMASRESNVTIQCGSNNIKEKTRTWLQCSLTLGILGESTPL